MYLDLYAIQAVPPANINRDDTGSPKTALYGGVRRARVSSQAWKRSIRTMFGELLPKDKLGVRTKFAVNLIAKKIEDRRPDLAERAEGLATSVLQALGVKVKASTRKGDTEGTGATEYLLFIAERELDALADIAIGWVDDGLSADKPDKAMKNQVKEAFHGVQAIDIALFGRMLADVPELNSDASCQVAHAISVDRVQQEYDYFTAVDDCAPDDNVGAGMIGTVEFNSSTLYRYATVDIDSLAGQLGDAEATAAAVKAFAEAFARSMPTGKQNTFANRTLPGTFIVAVRQQQPINLVTAFENPVRPSQQESISRQAERRLVDTIKEYATAFGEHAEQLRFVSLQGEQSPLSEVGVSESLPDMLANLEAYVSQRLTSEDA